MARSNAKSNGSDRRGQSNGAQPNGAQPSELAQEAVAEWRLALRYAVAAAKPVLGRGVERVKDRAKDRAAGVVADRHSLKDRLNPAKTEKGGRLGDAADAILARFGTPGKLAAKASLGSRAVDKVTPTPEPSDHPPDEDEMEAREEAADVAENEPSEGSSEDARTGGDEEDAQTGGDEDAEPVASEGDRKDRPEDEAELPVPRGEVEHKEIPSRYEHAYTDELENYEHREAYATTGS
jgi:hypothetical protein